MDSKQQKKLAERRLFTINDWPHSYPKPGTLRHLIFNSKKNGFDKVIRRVGRRILLDESAYFDWVDQQNK